MKNAINPAIANAATIGTSKIAGPPSNPPNTSDNIVVGSSVATDTKVDDDEGAAVLTRISLLVVAAPNISAAMGVAFNEVVVDDDVAIVLATLCDGTKASADERRAIRQNSIVVLCTMIIEYKYKTKRCQGGYVYCFSSLA